MTRPASDLLDGCNVAEGGGMRRQTSPALLPWVVLFASVLDAGRAAIEARAQEWRELFGAGDG